MATGTLHRLDEATRERVLARDGGRCWVARWLGGECHPTRHVHHIVPRDEGGTDDDDNLATVCASHHPLWERLRQAVLACRGPRWRRCDHRHPYPGGKAECERKLNAAA